MDIVVYCRLICNKKEQWIEKYRGVKEFHLLAHIWLIIVKLWFSVLSKPYIRNSHQLAHPCAPLHSITDHTLHVPLLLIAIWLVEIFYDQPDLLRLPISSLGCNTIIKIKSWFSTPPTKMPHVPHCTLLAPCCVPCVALHALAPLLCTLIPSWSPLMRPWCPFKSDWLNISMANLTKVPHHSQSDCLVATFLLTSSTEFSSQNPCTPQE